MSDFATLNILSWTCSLAYVCLNFLICKMRMALALKWSNGSFQNFIHMQIQISSCSSIPTLRSPSLVFSSSFLLKLQSLQKRIYIDRVFFFNYWCIVALQCVIFGCTAKWISHIHTYNLSFLDFLPI